MDLSSVNASSPSIPVNPQQSADLDVKIRSLEQKLRQLNAEREQAIRRKDSAEKEKIEKKLQEIRAQIERLIQQRERNAENASTPDAERAQLIDQRASDVGRYVDIYG